MFRIILQSAGIFLRIDILNLHALTIIPLNTIACTFLAYEGLMDNGS